MSLHDFLYTLVGVYQPIVIYDYRNDDESGAIKVYEGLNNKCPYMNDPTEEIAKLKVDGIDAVEGGVLSIDVGVYLESVK